MNAEKAKAILTQAKADETYEAEIPTDEAKLISEAEGLIEMAQQAWDQYTRGPEVEALLRIANEDFGSDNGNAPAAAAPEPEEETASSEAPVADGDDLSQVEPWDQYDNEKVSDIKAGIEYASKSDEYSDDELRELMSHVWQYEAAHKNRSTILDYLGEIAASHFGDGGAEEPAESQSEEAPAEEPQADPDEAVETEVPVEEPTPEPDPEPEPEPEPEEQPKPKKAPKKPDKKSPPPTVPAAESSGDEDFDELIKHVEEELERERLVVPKPPEEEIPEIPWDWTKISAADLQKLYMFYSNLAYYKSYRLSRDERLALHCKQAADELHRDLLNATDKYDENNKQRTMTLLEAEVESDPEVKKWRRRQRQYETFASAARQERDSYNKIVESMSRVETMRHNEWERSGGKVGKK